MFTRRSLLTVPFLLATLDAGAVDEEFERLRDREIDCCDVNGYCERVPALNGCRSATATGAAEDPAERKNLEETAPVDWLLADGGPYVTPRGNLASALVSHRAVGVLIGEVEDTYAYEGPRLGGWGINTWCTIRLDATYKGDFQAERIVVHYFGGQLPSGRRSYLSHEPRCHVGDRGIFTLYSVDGVLHADAEATFSMSRSELEWFEHPLTVVLEDLASEIGVP